MAGGENHPNHSGRTLGVLVSFIAVALLISPYHAQNTTSIFNTLYCAIGLTSLVPCESSVASPITQATSAKGESRVLSEQTSRNTSVSPATTTHITNVYNNTYPVTVLYKPDDVPLSYTPADVYLTATPVPLTPLELFKKQIESMQDDFGDRVRNAINNLEEDIADSVDTDSLSTDELTVNGTLSTTGGVTFTSLGGGILQTDALGNLSTTSISAGSISDDSLDFVQFRDALTLDASTDIAVSGSNVLSVTNSGTGNSFVVNDEAGDTSPFVISATGNVGIGTTTPSRSLHVVGNGIISERTAGSPQLVMRNLFGGVYQEWQLHVGNTGDLSFRDTTSGSADVFQIRSGAPSASFYLDSTGNLGLSDTTADYKLEVVGTLGVSSSATGDGDRFVVNSSGNVGIGTSTPSHKLTVAGDQLTTGYLSVANGTPVNATVGDITASRLFLGNYPAITTNVVAPLQVVGNSAATSQILSARYSDDTFPPGFQSAKARGTASAPAPVIIGDALYSLTGYGYASSGVFAQGSFIISVVDKTPTATAVPTALTFNVASSTTPLEAMRISSSRFVGIGYTNPSAKLHVVNTESVPSFLVEDTTVTDSTPFVIDENGAVGIGIGTVTRGKMEVIQATDGISGGIAVVNSGITGSMRMWVNSSGNAVIDNGTASGDLLLNPTNLGEVGIGTTTPSQLLTVAGNARITGALYDSTNSAGTSGYVLQSTGTGQQWVATSSLGFGTGSVAGTGSADRVAFWSGASSLSSDASFTFANSMLTAPTFNASGASTTVLSVNNVPFLQESTTQQSVSLGYGANALLGAGNIAIGEYALNQATTSDANYNTALGITALEFLTTGDNNVALGAYALQLNATGSENVAIGYLAGNQILTSGNTAIGFNALGNAWDYSARNTAIGYRAGYNVQSGFNNILLGYQAGESLQSGSYNIVIGNDIELQDSDWSNRLNIGNLLFGTGIDGTDTTLSTGNIGIGTTTPSARLTVAGTGLFTDTLTAPTFNASGASTTVLSFNDISLLATVNNTSNEEGDLYIGLHAGASSTPISAFANTAVGTRALSNLSNGVQNTALGTKALLLTTSGWGNTAIGVTTMESNTSGQENVAIGAWSLSNNTTGSYNTVLGNGALSSSVNGEENIAIGYSAGDNLTTGNRNIALGYDINFASSTGSGQLNIQNIIFGTNNTGTGGTLSTGNIGIGTTTPSAKLTVAGAGYFEENVSALYFDTSSSTGYHIGGVPIIYTDVTGSNADFAAGVGALGSRVEGSSFENTAVGEYALYDALSGQANTVVGYQAATQITTGDYNTAVGVYSLWSATSSSENTVLGYNAGGGARGSNNLLLGYNAGNSVGYGSNNIAIGYDVDLPNANASNQLNIGNLLFGTGIDGTGTTLSTGNIGIGTTTPSARLTVAGTGLFTDTLTAPTFNASGASSTVLSYNGSNLLYLDSGAGNMALTEDAFSQVDSWGGYDLTAFGSGALSSVTSGGENAAFGFIALNSNTTGSYNTAIGSWALENSTSSSNNTALGYQTGYSISTGENNTLLGSLVGDALTTGSNNILLGYDIDLQDSAWSNRLNIGNLLFGTGIDGTGTTLSTGNIGIGTTTPNAKLEVSGGGSGLALELNNTGTGDGLRINTADASANNGLLWYQGNDNLFNVYSNASNEGFLALYDAGITAVQLATNGASYFNGGNLGVGTTSATSRLFVESTTGSDSIIINATATGLPMMRWRDDGTERGAIYSLDGESVFRVRAGGDLYLDGGGASNGDVTISAAGDLGIGTTSPSRALHILNTNPTIRLQDTVSGASANPFVEFYGADGVRTGFVGDSSTGNSDITIASDAGVVTVVGTGGTCTLTGAASGGTCFSDERLKIITGEVGSVLEGLSTLNLKKFYWNDLAHEVTNASTTIENTGFLAQEVAEVFPELVYTNNEGYKTLDYSTLSMYNTVAIKELNERTRFLENASSSALLINSDSEIFWERLGRLVEGFVDGVLTLAGVTTNELCLKDENGSTCIDREELNALMRERDVSDNSQSGNEVPVEENDEDEVPPIASSTPETSSSSVPVIETDPVDEIVIDVPKTEEDVTEVAEEEVEEVVADEEDVGSEEPEEEVVESAPIAVGE